MEGKMKLHYGDMTDSSCLVKIISSVKPTEIYNLAAQSHVKVGVIDKFVVFVFTMDILFLDFI